MSTTPKDIPGKSYLYWLLLMVIIFIPELTSWNYGFRGVKAGLMGVLFLSVLGYWGDRHKLTEMTALQGISIALGIVIFTVILLLPTLSLL